jgi:FkbM family methyltransferase
MIYDVYEPGQVKSIFSHIHEDIGLFLLGGPANGNEAQVFHEQFPEVQIVGIEPNRELFFRQHTIGFPGLLLNEALSDKEGFSDFYIMGDGGRSSRLYQPNEQPSYRVRTVTIDNLLKHLDFRGQVALWLDIERSEVLALCGAKESLANKRIDVILLEVLPQMEVPILQVLEQYDFFEFTRVNCHDETDDAGNHVAYRYDGIYCRKYSRSCD